MTFAKLNRLVLELNMPTDMKQFFIRKVQELTCMSQSDKDFICDNIHNYEKVDQQSRFDVLDTIDGMELFTLSKVE